MKKNITINMFGMLFNIDEDAYQLLDNYLHNMKDYFSRREGGEEIADDIEHRVAELLAEMKDNGVEAVTIEHIQNIMHRVGNPQEMDDTEEDRPADGQVPPPPPMPQPEEPARRKFYRDGRDKMLGGVLSGMCRYFGGTSALPWRLIFILLCFVSFWGVAVVYVILWALIPEARTAEERLLMQGKPVTQENLNSEIMRGMTPGENLLSEEDRKRANGCLSTFLTIFVTCLKVLVILMLVSMFAGLVIFAGIMIVAAVCSILELPSDIISENWELGWILMQAPSIRWWAAGLVLSGMIVTLIPLYAMYRSFQPVKTSDIAPRKSRWGLLVTWICAFVVAVVTATGFIFTTAYYTKLDSERRHAEYITRNTHDGIYLSENSWDFLDESGWKVVELENAEDIITANIHSMDYMIDNDDENCDMYNPYLSMIQAKPDKTMRYKVEKRVEVAPGRYRIAAIMQTDGLGNAFFAKMGDKMLGNIDIREYAATDTVNSHRTEEFIFRRPASHKIDSVMASERMIPIDIMIDLPGEGVLEYGFTNDKDISKNPWSASYFNVLWIRIERVETKDAPKPGKNSI